MLSNKASIRPFVSFSTRPTRSKILWSLRTLQSKPHRASYAKVATPNAIKVTPAKSTVTTTPYRTSTAVPLRPLASTSTKVQPKAGWSTTTLLGFSAVALVVGLTISAIAPDAITTGQQSVVMDVRPIPAYGTAQDMEKAIAELRLLLGEDAVSTDSEVLLLHGYSSWSTTNVDRLPIAVAYPTTTQEVSDLVKICHKYKVPMIPFSGGSSLEGNFSAPFGGINIDFSFMDKIVALHEEDMDVVVQPAVAWMDLNDQIKDTGLFFPVDPGPSAMIGGMVGTNCSGTNAVRYGTMRDWVINLTVVLADGTIIKTRQRPRKSSAGYNLNSLFVGSEGTLGLVTEATLKLAVIPAETSVAVVTFPSIREAASAATKVIRAGIQVQAIEIMDDVQMSVINRSKSTNKVWKEVPTLFLKFSGSKLGIQSDIEAVRKIAKQHDSGQFEFAKTPAEQKSLWSARKEALWSMLALRDEKANEVWSTDVAVPLSRLADIMEMSKKDMDDLGMFASMLGHIGDGNFHESIMYDKTDPKQRKAVEHCVHTMIDRALEMEGTCTGEHGVGLGKKDYLAKELGLDTLALMRKVKLAMDPLWLLNPGKIVDVISPDLGGMKTEHSEKD